MFKIRGKVLTRREELEKTPRADLVDMILFYEDRIREHEEVNALWVAFEKDINARLAYASTHAGKTQSMFVDLESVIASATHNDQGNNGNQKQQGSNQKTQGRLPNDVLFAKAKAIRAASGKSVLPHAGDTEKVQCDAIWNWINKNRSKLTDDQLLNGIVNYSGNWGK